MLHFGEGNGNPLQYSCLMNSVNRGAGRATVHRVAKSWTWLSDFISFMFQLVWCRYRYLFLIFFSLINSVQSLSRVWLFVIPRTAVHQAPCPSLTTRACSTHVHRDGDTIQPSHLMSSPSPPTFNLSQHWGLCQWVSSLRQVAKVLELQLQYLSFQWIFKTDFL